MKKIILFIIVAITFVSCNSIERKAKSQMEETLREMMKDPSSMEILSQETEFVGDSVCIIKASVSGKNGFGGVSKSDYEYIYVIMGDKDETKTMEAVRNLEKKSSILKTSHETYDILKKANSENKKSQKSDKEIKETAIHLNAMFVAMFEGREVGKKQNKDAVDNW